MLGLARLRAESVLFFVMGWHRVVGMRQACSESGSGYQMKKILQKCNRVIELFDKEGLITYNYDKCHKNYDKIKFLSWCRMGGLTASEGRQS